MLSWVQPPGEFMKGLSLTHSYYESYHTLSGGTVAIVINDNVIDISVDTEDGDVEKVGVDASDLFHLAALFTRAFGRASKRDNIQNGVSGT